MIMDNKVKQKTVGRTKVERHLEVIIVNGLDINLNCPIEIIGNQVTIWINKNTNDKTIPINNQTS